MDTRDNVVYNSIKEVAVKFGYNFSTLRKHLHDLVENRTPFKLIVDVKEDGNLILKEYITKNKSPKLHVNNKAVDMYDKQNNFIRSFISASEAAREINATSGNILKCCNNVKGYKSIKGYIFKHKI